MNFTNHLQMIQVFANEYCNPKSLVLLIGNIPNLKEIRNIFEFINSQVIVIGYVKTDSIDVIVYQGKPFPFESNSFDLIVDFENVENVENVNSFLKPNGRLLTKGNIVGSLERYSVSQDIFCVC